MIKYLWGNYEGWAVQIQMAFENRQLVKKQVTIFTKFVQE